MGNAKKTPAGRTAKSSKGRSGSAGGKTAARGVSVKVKPAASRQAAVEYETAERMRPELKAEIGAIVLFALAVLLFIGIYVSSGGALGEAAKGFLVGSAGFGAYTLPFILLIWGMTLILGKSKAISLSKLIMGLCVFIIVISFIHIAGTDGVIQGTTFTEYITAYYDGGSASNGGLVGAVAGNFFMGILGRAGACILLIAGAIVLLILVTGKSLVDFLVRMFVKIDGELTKISENARVAAQAEGGRDSDTQGAEADGFVDISIAGKRELPPIREVYGDRSRKKGDKRKVYDFVIDSGGEEPEWEYGGGEEPEIHLMGDSRKKRAHDPMDKIVSFRKGLAKEAPLKEAPLKEGPSIKPEDAYAAPVIVKMPSDPGLYERETEPMPELAYDVDLTESAMEGLAAIGSPFGSPAEVINGVIGEGISVKGIGVEGYVPITVTTSGEDFVAASKEPSEPEAAEKKEKNFLIHKDINFNKTKEHKENLEYGDGEEKPYIYPGIDLLAENNYVPSPSSKAQILENSRKLEDTLRSFHVEAKVVEVSKGPTVTRYELSPGVGVKVSQISKLADDLALNLAAMGIRIEAPVPGKSVVGVEIPNSEVQTVFLRDVVDDQAFWNFPSKLSFAVGKDIAGNTVIVDIAKMPHLLIAGATGSGKSVCINTIIASILFKSNPDEVRMLMIDPKVVELNVYNGIPHLEIPVVTDPQKAAGALSWGVREMNGRYNLFAKTGTRDLKGYNAALAEEGEKPLPQIVIVIDELADLMMSCKAEVEQNICRLAQKARAAGIHLIVATQRPSVDVITGLIKANIPSRLAFAVTSGTDSRTILDMVGAEKLLGKGDMLFSPAGLAKPQRIQGAFISDKEVERLVAFIKKENGEAVYDSDKIEEITATGREEEDFGEGSDEFMKEAMDFVAEKGKASVSMLQRRFRIGYNRAARMME
ncbi:MAG: DNA translocase FtsK, partial [Clostridiales bacterium]|nr:DNA translocase FtsK [Clostridiales bacterium]